VSLAYNRAGAGPPLVLLHPLGADRHVWEPVMDRLAAERDVIALDLPGFGGSPALSGASPPTPAALAAAVAEFLPGIAPGGPHHVAGNSLGGWVALELASAGHARSVTAIAPAGLWPEPLAWAEHDRLVARPAHLPPTVRSVVLPGAGHLPMWDAPEAVAKVLLRGSRH
jgi:pimeloyl-ACP methyl ester carboxylesterase